MLLYTYTVSTNIMNKYLNYYHWREYLKMIWSPDVVITPPIVTR